MNQRGPVTPMEEACRGLVGPGPFSELSSASTKIVQKIFHDLMSIADAKNSRCVCRDWNFAIAPLLNFTVRLSDMTILSFLRMRRPESLVPILDVVKMIVADLSALSAPFSPEALQDVIKCPKNMKTLHFLEGVTPSVKQNFLVAFRWIENLKFEKTPLPTFPKDIIFEHLTKFEMSPGAYNESDEVKIFFHTVHFPALSEMCIQIHCRSDYHLYAAVHCFIARHHRTLHSVKLLFLESLTMVTCYDSDIYAKDFRQIILEQKMIMEKQKEHQHFLTQVPLLQLNSLNLWLIDNEEFLALSLMIIDAQKSLRLLDINHPYGYRDMHTDFSVVIKNNCRTLTKLTLPRLPQFDCKMLTDCVALESFSLGMEFHFYDFENFGTVINVQEFPSLAKIRSVCMGSPMTQDEIYFMMNHVPAQTFLFIGSQEYSVKDVKKLVDCGRVDKKTLMMCVPMSQNTFKHLQVYLNKHTEIGVRVIYHCRPNELTSGTAHFSLCFDNNNYCSTIT